MRTCRWIRWSTVGIVVFLFASGEAHSKGWFKRWREGGRRPADIEIQEKTQTTGTDSGGGSKMPETHRPFNGAYEGEYLSRVAFPMGGIGAGMICLEGSGAFSHFSLRNQPEVFNEPCVFSALCVKGSPNVARILEGPAPSWKTFGRPGSGNGSGGTSLGLPRFASARFLARFPFATIDLSSSDIPLNVTLTGWSPFVPGDADRSSLPVAGVEYRFVNGSDQTVEAVYSFHAVNFMDTTAGGEAVQSSPEGFILWQPGKEKEPWHQGAFCAEISDKEATANCAWFRGGWFDSLTMNWQLISEGQSPANPPPQEGGPSRGGSLYVPFNLKPGQEKVIRLRMCWHVPCSQIRQGKDVPDAAPCEGSQCEGTSCGCYQPWYSGRFEDVQALARHWREEYEDLQKRSAKFRECFYDTTLPPEVVEAVVANLTILKSPTVLRQKDGRLWCWEGCCDNNGCCHGSCTHVWNYAQALPHLFPELERTLRQTEFHESQDDRGHQMFRSSLPVRETVHDFHAASDGQLGGVMKVHRDWRIFGDMEWLRELWPQVKASLDYCIETWDPDHTGTLVEPHHNTYDIEFWGPDGMCSSFYLGALQAASSMAEALGEDIPLYRELLNKGRKAVETDLFNGEYFIQQVRWTGLRAKNPLEVYQNAYSSEAAEILQKEGPKYQYGMGCLSDGVLGAWMAEVCGVGEILDEEKVKSHLRSVHRYNLKHDLSSHANPQRPSFAMGEEGGLLLCSYPRGGRLSLPFPYSEEVWTGIEYQVASHLLLKGLVEEGLDIVRTARHRYDGRIRNPFNEYECGHWYARAMSSYGLIQGLSGIRYDAVDKTLTVSPSLSGDFRSFLCVATGYGTVGVREGKPFVEVKEGKIEIEKMILGKE